MNSQNLSVSGVAARALVGLGVAVLALPLYAQDATTTGNIESARIDEIIVTANKREESVQDVAQVVSVVTGEALKDLEIREFREIATTVSGLSLSRVSGGEQSVSMRGIKMSNPGGASSATNTVEMYVNEVPITAIDSFNSMFDVGQVEVLRGPQGTLRGRPSPSGAITITPRRGSHDESDGFVSVGASDNGGLFGEAAWGGPVSDNVAVRLAGLYDESDDNALKSLATGKHSYHKATGLRGSLSWMVTDNFEINLMHQYNDQEQDFYRGVAGTVIFPDENEPDTNPWLGETFTYEDRVSLNQPNPNNYTANLTTLTATYDFGGYALNYVGGYKDAHFDYLLDFDFAGVGGPYLYIDNDSKAKSNELRFESTEGEFYNFVLGVFTSAFDNKGGATFQFSRPVPPDAINPNPYTFEDTGYFMNHRFTIGDRSDLSVGFRRSEYKVDRSGEGVDVKYSHNTGNASYQFQFTDDLMAYVSYGKSFRPGSGGANTTNNPIPVSYANYEEETSTSLEIGMKAQWFGRRLTLNLAYYDQNYDGFIAVTNNVACTGVPNPDGLGFATDDGTAEDEDFCRQNVSFNGDAVASGIDLELRALVTDNWMLGLNYSYVDAHFENSLIPCNDYNGDGNPDNEGDPMIQQGMYVSECYTSAALGQISPNSFTALTEYNFDIGSFGAYIRGNMSYNEESYFPQTGQYLPSDTRVNAFVGLTSPDNKWDVSLWSKNLFDKVVQDNDGGTWNVRGTYTGLNIGTITRGRELGVTLRRDF